MVSVDEFSRLVAGIYAAAATPQYWAAGLDDIRRATGASHCGLFVADTVSRPILGATMPMEAGRSYTEYYHRLDYVLTGLGCGPVGTVRTGPELMRPAQNREFHEDWLRHIGVDDGLFVRLTDGPRPTCLVVGILKHNYSPDTPDRLQLARRLVPHLQQSLRIHHQLCATDSAADLYGALDAIRHGVLMVESLCGIVNMNSAAEHVLRAEDGIRLDHGRIGVTDPVAARHLHQALHRALHGASSGVRGADTFLCRRPSGRRAYVVSVMPLIRKRTHESYTRPLAVVLIKDPEREAEPVTALLRRLYRLTATEAGVAVRLAAGAGPRQIADESSVSYQTIRTHLQHVYDKTDTHRQAELMKLVVALDTVH